jgi:hypothetical protein
MREKAVEAYSIEWTRMVLGHLFKLVGLKDAKAKPSTETASTNQSDEHALYRMNYWCVAPVILS